MDIGYVIVWMVSAMLFVRWFRSFRHPLVTGKSIRFTAPLLALTFIVVYQIHKEALAASTALLYFLMIYLPQRILVSTEKALREARYKKAIRLSHFLKWLHPGDLVWDLPTIIEAIETQEAREKEDIVAPSIEILCEKAVWSSYVRFAALHFTANTGDWKKIVDWCRKLRAQEPLIEPVLILTEIRALGEVGNYSEQLDAAEYLLQLRHHKANRKFAELFIDAFHGNLPAVEQNLNAHLRGLPEEVKVFWRLSALKFSGDTTESTERFQRLKSQASPRARIGINRRLESSATLPEPHLIEKWALIKQTFAEDEVAVRPSTPWATYSIATVLMLVFAYQEYSGGSESLFVLIKLGAFYPQAYQYGETYRFLTGGLLHFGWVHLAMNLFGLTMLGPLVERLFGPIKTILFFIICLVGSTVGVATFYFLGLAPTEIMVGASGGVMGMIGFLGAYFLLEWAKYRTIHDRQRLGSVALAMAIQVVFDLSTENVSFAGHLSGAFVGFVISFTYYLSQRKLTR